MADKKQLLQKFSDMKFGMFIHFGLYSLGEFHEWHMHRKKMSKEEYAKEFVPQFDPDPKGMEQWVLTAKKMGAKYITVTTKHHDGFCLWDTKVPHPIMPKYNIRSTPFYKKNNTGVIEILYEACEKHDMKLGLYYSTIDWSYIKKRKFRKNISYRRNLEFREEYISYYLDHCRELKNKFPNIIDFWFDGYQLGKGWGREPLKQKEVYKILSDEFPDLLIASNPGCSAGVDAYEGATDIRLLENPGNKIEVREIEVNEDDSEIYGEICCTINQHWGYNAADHNYMDPQYVIDLLNNNNSKNINLLLNFGPHWNGFILDEQVEIAKQIGNLIKN